MIKTFLKGKKQASQHISIKQYNKEIDEAMARMDAGQFVTQEALEKEAEQSLIRPARRKNIIQLVEELPKPAVKLDGNLEEAYFEGQKKKYGF
jgi:hypothetical protein